MNKKTGWKPEEYLRFEEERTRPCRDLVSRIAVNPQTVIDLGCGPGNSTAVIAERWPMARITGLDSSEPMLTVARASSVKAEWIQREIAEWAEDSGPQYDLVLSNAALQWVGEHALIFPRLMRRVAPGGVLAVQIPADVNAPAHRIMRERFPGGQVCEWFAHQPSFYYDFLAPESRRLDIWTTEYLHVMPGVEAIAEWYRSTGMRPFLNALGNDEQRERFVRDYIEGLRAEFTPQADGRVLFPFLRVFVIAGK